jgi:class 3 adenylate cyclase
LNHNTADSGIPTSIQPKDSPLYGDDALRAVRAAVEIQALIPMKLRAASGPLAAHVALAMGDVVASRVGSERRREYTVIGEAANLAARLLDHAEACEILASEEIWRATAQFADYEALGGRNFKGLDDPVPVFRLKGLRASAAERRRSSVAALSLPNAAARWRRSPTGRRARSSSCVASLVLVRRVS